MLLIERKARLKKLLRRKRSRVLFVDHIEARGRQFFEKICELDLEGIVAKRKQSPVSSDREAVAVLGED